MCGQECLSFSFSNSLVQCQENLNHDDHCRPQTHGEEELQLQLALAMSREEAEAEDSKKKSDDMRLQMAIAKSKEENKEVGGVIHVS